MKEELAFKWADALESGDYPQGKGALRTDEGLCCLGVLCNLHALEHPAIAAAQTRPDEYLGNSAILPNEVKVWAGMYSPHGAPTTGRPIKGKHAHLAQANDHGLTFKQIGKWIRKNYKDL